MESPRRVGFLGLGIMGRPMAENLRAAGFDVVVWNRTRSKADDFAAGGVSASQSPRAVVAATPAEAAAATGVVVSMVPDAPEVDQVLLGPDGAAMGLAEGGLCIDMSTIPPTAARAIAERLAERGIDFLDAPVTGSRPKAEDGTLTIMVGGPPESLERARPLFEAMGQQVIHVGPTGHGAMAKLINNTVGAINAAALGEGLVLARESGLDVDALRQVIGSGSGSSAMLELKAGPMLEHDFEPLFKLEHMLKDVRHCLSEARALGVRFALAETAERLYAEADQRGLGGRDFAAVVEAAEAAAGH
jgi:3-hydroxyisobutyrate dehydrogenase-like beta-hydroxyacid dehydrogenase